MLAICALGAAWQNWWLALTPPASPGPRTKAMGLRRLLSRASRVVTASLQYNRMFRGTIAAAGAGSVRSSHPLRWVNASGLAVVEQGLQHLRRSLMVLATFSCRDTDMHNRSRRWHGHGIEDEAAAANLAPLAIYHIFM